MDLFFTEGINLAKKINYECFFRKSAHVVLKIEIKKDMENKQEKSCKKKRGNYAKANYTAMKRFFNLTNWMKIKELKNLQEK